MNIIFSLTAGLVFGLGLVLSGMANPAKVLGFLDLAGPWDPSLVLVMCGAIAVAYRAFVLATKRTSSLLGLPMQLPTARGIDRNLVGGSLTFGVGWGLAGICPGPALVLVGAGLAQGLIFVGAMLTGMGFVEFLRRGAP